MFKYFTIIFFAIFAFSSNIEAQETFELSDPDAAFKSAKQFYQQDQFSLAFSIFKRLFNNGIKQSNMPFQIMADAQYYYIAVSYTHLDVYKRQVHISGT